MTKILSPLSFSALFGLLMIGCHGAPPPESTSSVDEPKVEPSTGDSLSTTSDSASPAAAPAPDTTDKPAASDSTVATSSPNDCARGGCRFTCASGKTCDEKCKGGACDLKVEKDAKGSLDCAAGSCKINCLPGATCNLKCGGGYCKSICAAGSTCNVDCEGKDGQCETECAKGATCDVKCPTNNCKPEPKKSGKK
jgi:hypothetical protein